LFEILKIERRKKMAKEKEGKQEDVKMKKAVVTQDLSLGKRFYKAGDIAEFTEEQCIRFDILETDIDLGKKKAQAWQEEYNKMLKPNAKGIVKK
jgi:hypothetical protein